MVDFNTKLTAFLGVMVLSGCLSSEDSGPKTLVPVSTNVTYNAEQAHAICHSEALNVRSAVRASGPTRITVNTVPTGGGFASGFADGFNRNFNPGPSGDREGKAAYAACVARHGYVLR